MVIPHISFLWILRPLRTYVNSDNLLLCYQSVFHINLRKHRPAHLTPPWPSSHFKLWLSNWSPSYLRGFILLFSFSLSYTLPSSIKQCRDDVSELSASYSLYFLLDFVSTMITVASTVFFTFQEHSNMSSKQNDVYIVNYSCFLPEAISICSYVLWDFPSTLSLDCPSSSTKMGNAKIQMRLYMNKGPRALVLSYKSSYYLLLELLWDPLLHYHTSWCLLSKPHCFLRSNNF